VSLKYVNNLMFHIITCLRVDLCLANMQSYLCVCVVCFVCLTKYKYTTELLCVRFVLIGNLAVAASWLTDQDDRRLISIVNIIIFCIQPRINTTLSYSYFGRTIVM